MEFLRFVLKYPDLSKKVTMLEMIKHIFNKVKQQLHVDQQ